MKSEKLVENLLQKARFKRIIPLIEGKTVLDFGGNHGELKKYIPQEYTICNLNYQIIKDKQFDNIVSLAVIEHIEYLEVFKIISMLKKHLNENGKIILTTPTKLARPFLEFLAIINLLDPNNMAEHKHYWSKKELSDLAEKSGLKMIKHKLFQLGMNQLAIFKQS